MKTIQSLFALLLFPVLALAGDGFNVTTSPGGTNGQVQYNNAGAFGGAALGSNIAITGGTLTLSNVALTTGNLSQFAATTSAQFFGVISDEIGSGKVVADTNTVLTTATFAGTTTATGQIRASTGTASAPGISFTASTNTGFVYTTLGGVTTAVDWVGGGTRGGLFDPGGLFIKSTGVLGWQSDDVNGLSDTKLVRDAANTLAQRNGTNAQAFDLYNTFTDTSNYERFSSKWSGNVLILKAEALGSGTQHRIDIIGTATNDNAASGANGEYVSASIVSGSAVSLSSATPKTITSIVLTAGDWDITAIGALTGASTGTEFDVAIGTTTNSFTGTVLGDTRCQTPTVSLTGADASLMIPAMRASIAATGTYYLIIQETFTVGTPAAYGRISARRAR